MTRKKLQLLIEDSIEELQKEKAFPAFDLPEIKLEHPENEYHGDYATNVAMILAKQANKSPKEVADLLALKIKAKGKFLEKVEVAGPGFINFFISKEQIAKEVEDVLKQKEKFGKLAIGKGKKINLEYCSANPTGPLHLGHGRGVFWGDVLSKVLDSAGYKVTREYFINDYGRQIYLLGKSINVQYLKLLGEEAEMEDEFYKGEYVKEIAEGIVKKEAKKYLELSEKERINIFSDIGLNLMLVETKKLFKKIGVDYDVWFSEKTIYKKGLVEKTIKLLKDKGFTYEKEGALWFSSTKFGDDKDRVLVKADGGFTYFASDSAYHLDKVSRKYDFLIDGWGADHWGYKSRLMAVAKVLGFGQKLKIIVGQFVRLVEKGKEVKMSKRGGTFFALEDLVLEIGSDVSRFFFLMKSVDTHIDFNLDLAKQQSEKNPVFYVQYAHARISSILKKAKIIKPKLHQNSLKEPSELNLVKLLFRLPEVVEDTSQDYQVQRLPQYAMELAASFHRFYQECKVISEDKEITQSRLALVSATKIVLKNTLELMGISAPEKM